MPLEHFYSENAPYVDVLSWPHIAYLLFCGVVIFHFVRSHKSIREHREKVGKIMLGIILFQQIFLMYGWYLLTASNLLKNALPLEMCRISTLLTIVFLITKDNRFMDVIFYFSIYALASLFCPKNVYHFLHVNGLSYMINHLMTVLTPHFWCHCLRLEAQLEGLHPGCRFFYGVSADGDYGKPLYGRKLLLPGGSALLEQYVSAYVRWDCLCGYHRRLWAGHLGD